jgi:Ras-related protein Rab-4B
MKFKNLFEIGEGGNVETQEILKKYHKCFLLLSIHILIPHCKPLNWEPLNEGMIAQSAVKKSKVVLVGSVAVGKTSLLNQLVDRKFNLDEVSTLGANFQVFYAEFDEMRVEIQIWDTAGGERFSSLGPIYYRGARGAVIVYDVTSRESFEGLEKWIESVKEIARDVVIFIVGNKKDLEKERQVSYKEASKYAEQNDYDFYETSALSGDGVEDVFMKMATKLVEIEVAASGPGLGLSNVEKKKEKCDC